MRKLDCSLLRQQQSRAASQTSHQRFTMRMEPEENGPLQCGTTEEVAHDPQEADPCARTLVGRGVHHSSTRCVQCEHLPCADRSEPRLSNTTVGQPRVRGRPS